MLCDLPVRVRWCTRCELRVTTPAQRNSRQLTTRDATPADFGYKGTDTAQAAYCAELDALTPPLTSHVLSAEMHNQAVNSLALVSARR